VHAVTYTDSDVQSGCAIPEHAQSAPTITEPHPAWRHPVSPLTSRQCEVLALSARGLRAKQVADRLGLSVRTIEKHKQDIMRKLRVRTTVELLRWYLAAPDRPSGGG
jgi:DNA-binding NarL/FixJ family response regulator